MRVTPQQAAETLGTSVEAIRQRIRRGTLRSYKDEDGSVWIDLDPSVHHTYTDHTTDQTPLVARLDSEVQYLRQQLEQANERDREQRRIIAMLTSRIPELPAATDHQEPAESPQERAEETPEEEPPKRSLWERWFGAR